MEGLHKSAAKTVHITIFLWSFIKAARRGCQARSLETTDRFVAIGVPTFHCQSGEGIPVERATAHCTRGRGPGKLWKSEKCSALENNYCSFFRTPDSCPQEAPSPSSISPFFSFPSLFSFFSEYIWYFVFFQFWIPFLKILVGI